MAICRARVTVTSADDVALGRSLTLSALELDAPPIEHSLLRRAPLRRTECVEASRCTACVPPNGDLETTIGAWLGSS